MEVNEIHEDISHSNQKEKVKLYNGIIVEKTVAKRREILKIFPHFVRN
jgi:hypothetical protein